jgi:hypothetical protein
MQQQDSRSTEQLLQLMGGESELQQILLKSWSYCCCNSVAETQTSIGHTVKLF